MSSGKTKLFTVLTSHFFSEEFQMAINQVNLGSSWFKSRNVIYNALCAKTGTLATL